MFGSKAAKIYAKSGITVQTAAVVETPTQHYNTTTQTSSANKKDAADRLKEAHQMHKDGLLNEEEFNQIKQKLMAAKF